MSDFYGVAIIALMMAILIVGVIIVDRLKDLIDGVDPERIRSVITKIKPGVRKDPRTIDVESMHPDLPINYQQSLISIDAAVTSNEKRIDALEKEVNRLRDYIREHAIQLKQHEEKLNEIYIEE